ncbi:MAG TPA: cobyrinate a,c-diamide synthase [Gemmataceae bacterium]|nr:cobyrinate a,c-diamide synthase [Gemmataceae bacterium]
MTARLVIAGTHSGVGKTTIAAGLIVALRSRGLTVQPFKVGPDYIDGGHHSVAAGRPCRNLDTWMMPPQSVRSLFAHACRDADLAVMEGVMGVYDGAGYEEETGSTAEVAKLLQAPVILVVDANKLARSAAAVALGYQRFDPALPLIGFIINRAGSDHHGAGVTRAVEQATGLPVFGWLPRDERLRFPERHLGLMPAAETPDAGAFVEAAGDVVTRHLDLDRLLASVRVEGGEWRVEGEDRFSLHPLPSTPHDHPRPIIAVARDEAFHFTYEEDLELLQAAGARLAFFSPLRDTALPDGAAGAVLSGGFPEMHAAQLAANVTMKQALRDAHERGLPIYAECGGLMYLTEKIVDHQGREHDMVGLLPGCSVMSRQLTLGYRRARAASASWLFAAGETVRGHEFHYSHWQGRPANLPPAYALLPSSGGGEISIDGACLGSLLASYVHLNMWGKPELAERFVAACRG